MFKRSFIFQLKTVYWIEKHLPAQVLRLEKASTTSTLKTCLRSYYALLKKHIKRIECSFYMLHEKKQTKKYESLFNLFEKAKKNVKATVKYSDTREMEILSAIESIETEGIKAYEKLLDLAYAMGEFDVADLIEDSLEEEREAMEVFRSLCADRQKTIPTARFVPLLNLSGPFVHMSIDPSALSHAKI